MFGFSLYDVGLLDCGCLAILGLLVCGFCFWVFCGLVFDLVFGLFC